MLVVFRGAAMIRSFEYVKPTSLSYGHPDGSDADSVFVFGCTTMGRESMTTMIREMIPGSRALNAGEWYQRVLLEYRTLVMDASKAAFEELGFLIATPETIYNYVLEWHRQIWLTVAREGLAE